jgi:hypothetical protein
MLCAGVVRSSAPIDTLGCMSQAPPTAVIPRVAPQGPSRGFAQTRLPWIAAALVMVVTVAVLRYEGRIWWCAKGDWSPWAWDVWTSHCSQHVIDPYSVSHFMHGLAFWAMLLPLAGLLSVGWRFCIAIALAAGWEVLENSSLIIERYRAVTMSLDYLGDSVTNATADVLCCAAGFAYSQRVGLKWTLLSIAAAELISLWWIRDNVVLNLIMLIHPVDAIREWQSAGHVLPQTVNWLWVR